MEVVRLTLLCCRHALVLLHHRWTTLADAESIAAPLGARSRLKAGG